MLKDYKNMGKRIQKRIDLTSLRVIDVGKLEPINTEEGQKQRDILREYLFNKAEEELKCL